MNRSADNVFHYVVPTSWVEHTGRDALVSWQLSSDVWLVLVFDQSGTVINARPEDLQAFGWSEEEAFDYAARNLIAAWEAEQFSVGMATLLDGTVIGCSRGNWMAPAAAIVLGNFHGALREHFQTEVFAAVPVNQQCLFAFPTDPATLDSESLRLAIDDEFTQHPKPISRSWLLLDGQWPREYPGPRPF